MYIKVACLAGVSTGDGLSIPPSSWKGAPPKIRMIPMAIPAKTFQLSMVKVASRPQYYIQTHAMTGYTASQNTGELDLRIGYHRLDISPLPINNLPYILHQLDLIHLPTDQSSTGQSQKLQTFQQTPSTTPP